MFPLDSQSEQALHRKRNAPGTFAQRRAKKKKKDKKTKKMTTKKEKHLPDVRGKGGWGSAALGGRQRKYQMGDDDAPAR